MHKWIVPFLVYNCLFSFGNNKTIASSFWTPDSDTALLFQLVSNSMTQINELEQLISSAQKHTETFEKYNQLAKITTLEQKEFNTLLKDSLIYLKKTQKI